MTAPLMPDISIVLHLGASQSAPAVGTGTRHPEDEWGAARVTQKEVRRHALECHNAKAAVLQPPEGCFLQYSSIGSKQDSNEGLLHQMSSLGTALAEAHFLGRMLVLPDAWCIPGKHMSGPVRHRRCFAYNQLYDLGLLSTVIPSVAPTQVASLEKNRRTSLESNTDVDYMCWLIGQPVFPPSDIK